MIGSVLAAFGLANPESSRAQTPNDFFPKDYVPSTKGQRSPPVESQSEDSFKEIGEDPAPAPNLTPAATPTLALLDSPGKPVEWLGVAFDATSEEQASLTLDHFVSIIDRLHIRPGKIYAVCNPDNPLPSGLQQLAISLRMRGAEFLKVREVPKELNIRLSPTWLVQTSDGTSLLEGTTTPERQLNVRGEFVPPQQ